MDLSKYVLVIETCLDMYNHTSKDPTFRQRRQIPLPILEFHVFNLPSWLVEKDPHKGTYKYVTKGHIHESADQRLIDELFSIHGCYCGTECTVQEAYITTLEKYNTWINKPAIKKYHDFSKDVPIGSTLYASLSPPSFLSIFV